MSDNEDKTPWTWPKVVAHIGNGIGTIIVLLLIIYIFGGFDQLINKWWP